MDDQQTQTLKYKPAAIGGVNLLLYGSGYLFLHRYLRFFIFYIALLIASVFLGKIGIAICYVAVIVDSVILAKKVHSGEKELPPVNTILNILIVVLILFGLVFSFMPKNYLAYSEDSCKFLAPIKGDGYESISAHGECLRMVNEGKTLFTFLGEKPLKDDKCEAEELSDMKEICYFKKALETKNYKYCNYQGYGSDTICISNLAGILKDKSICENHKEKTDKAQNSVVSKCYEIVDECKSGNITAYTNFCKPVESHACDKNSWVNDKQELVDDCIAKYGLVMNE